MGKRVIVSFLIAQLYVHYRVLMFDDNKNLKFQMMRLVFWSQNQEVVLCEEPTRKEEELKEARDTE